MNKAEKKSWISPEIKELKIEETLSGPVTTGV